MSARRGTTQYNDGCRAFMEFAVRNCTTADGKIYCPCKNCRNNQWHAPAYVIAHLIEGRGMSSKYSLWYMHDEIVQGVVVPGRCSSHPSVTDAAAGSTEQVECMEQGGGLEHGGDMHAMLRDAFGVHEVGEAFSTQQGE
jgi:hypothetical protein